MKMAELAPFKYGRSRRIDRCLMPGKTKPVKCPTA